MTAPEPTAVEEDTLEDDAAEDDAAEDDAAEDDAARALEEEVPDRLDVPLPTGARVLVCGDLHLGSRPTAASARLERDLVDRLARWDGPGAVVLNGDVVELWGEPGGTVEAALDAHPDLTRALREFAAAPGRHVVVVVGNHDAPIAWDRVSADTFARRIGARCALSVDLDFGLHPDAPAGRRIVRCEHGHAFDPANALHDPRNPWTRRWGSTSCRRCCRRCAAAPCWPTWPPSPTRTPSASSSRPGSCTGASACTPGGCCCRCSSRRCCGCRSWSTCCRSTPGCAGCRSGRPSPGSGCSSRRRCCWPWPC
ncbi:metallophosphoesterase family protein [Dactylosporangium cerinum]